MVEKKKKNRDKEGGETMEGDVTEDNKGRGGDGTEAEAGKRAAQEDKKAKKTCQRKKREAQRKLVENAAVASCGEEWFFFNN